MPTPGFFFFDLGNVLLHFDHQIACQNLAKLCSKTAEEIYAIIFASDLNSRYETGQLTTEEFYQQFCDAVGEKPDFAATCLAASAIFTPNFSLFPIVTQLKSEGRRLGILSNTCDAHWQYAIDGRYRILNDVFEIAVLSFEEHCSKPDRRFYDVAVEKAGLDAEQIFFVDDRPENVSGAKSVGIDAVQYLSTADLVSDLHKRNVLKAI